jgi:hypothetical protein
MPLHRRVSYPYKINPVKMHHPSLIDITFGFLI